MLDWLPYLKINNNDPDRHMLIKAYRNAVQSIDPSTQVGSIIDQHEYCHHNRNSHGYNGFPNLIEEKSERLINRETKLKYIEHAERRAIYHAAAFGIPTQGRTMYATWFSCIECARAIIDCGINRVYGHFNLFEKTPDRWKEQIQFAFELFKESGVICEAYQGKLNIDHGGFLLYIRFNGELFVP